MQKLLYIEASPRKDRSHSIKVAQSFLQTITRNHPDVKVDTLDLWNLDLPEFDNETINAKYSVLSGQNPEGEEQQAWNRVVETAKQFSDADFYLFSVPMWNFGIPYKLKHYIDVVTQPGLTFTFSPDSGYSGLIKDRPAIVIYSSGGEYGEGSGVEFMDFQQSYMETWLKFIGFDQIQKFDVPRTVYGPDAAAASENAAIEKAVEFARSLTTAVAD